MQPISGREIARAAYATAWFAVVVSPVFISHDSGLVASWMALLFWVSVLSQPAGFVVTALALAVLLVVVARSPFVEVIAIVAAMMVGAVLMLFSAFVVFIVAPEKVDTCRGDSCDQPYFEATAIYALAIVYLALGATLLTAREPTSASPLARRARRFLRGGSASLAAATAAYLMIAMHVGLAPRPLAEFFTNNAVASTLRFAANAYPPSGVLTNGAALATLLIVGGRAAGWISLRQVGIVTMGIGLAVVVALSGLGLIAVITGAELDSQPWRRLGILCANGLWLAVLGSALAFYDRLRARSTLRSVGTRSNG